MNSPLAGGPVQGKRVMGAEVGSWLFNFGRSEMADAEEWGGDGGMRFRVFHMIRPRVECIR